MEVLKMKNVISKNEFCKIIKQLRGANDLQNQVGELYQNSECNRAHDFCNYGALQINHESIVLDLLKFIFNDIYDNISYFVYELDYGRKYTPDSITYIDENGNNATVDLSTEEKLYDYLIANMKESEKE